jgi:hypothetical protein
MALYDGPFYRVRNRRICRETQAAPELFAVQYDPDDPSLLQNTVRIPLHRDDMVVEVSSNFPFQPPTLLYRGKDSSSYIRALRAEVQPLVTKYRLETFGCCSCCTSLRVMWSPVYTIKAVIDEFLPLSARLESLKAFQELEARLGKKYRNWDDLINERICQYF